MKIQRDYPVAVITNKGADWVSQGHPWIYEGEVLSVDEGAQNGCLVDALSQKGRYLGTGFLSTQSKIRIRLISRNANDRFDSDFWKRRVEYAWRYRKQVMGNDLSCCRVIFGEADLFPGLTADLFSDVLVTQTMSLGTEQLKDTIFPHIYHTLCEEGIPLRGIYERNDVKLRELEGLSENKGWYEGLPHSGGTETEITENGIKYTVDFENGQKTGFFLDQKYNRKATAAISKGLKVLDCFTHTGSFALNCAAAGAKEVTAVDVSAQALETAKKNAALNGIGLKYIEADVFELLPEITKNEYDLIILDPPAFTKSRKTALSAAGGYREINRRAMKLLPRGGYLATCSCSHFMPEELFKKQLDLAAQDSGVQLRQIEARRQSPDHPILWRVPETDYLKFYIFQVV